jgi:hypothetical protein
MTALIVAILGLASARPFRILDLECDDERPMRVVPPKGAPPHVLLIMTDDTCFGVFSTS